MSPMEAESECAFLNEIGLVDGVITNDSDVFLFGGQNVYRNMFKQDKQIENYSIADIQQKCNLDRSKLISLSQLLGCDYCDGIVGIGPTIANEIIQNFSNLSQFKQFLQNPNNTEKKLSRKLVRLKIYF